MAGNFDRKLRLPRIHFRVLLYAANMRHEANGFTSFPKEGVLRIFFALKNPTASVGFEPSFAVTAILCYKIKIAERLLLTEQDQSFCR